MAPELIYLDKERIARRGDKPMGGAEKLDEAEWLREGGLHQLVVAQRLGTTVKALEKLAYRHERVELGSWFALMKNQARWAS
jgi:hypothetical protein